MTLNGVPKDIVLKGLVHYREQIDTMIQELLHGTKSSAPRRKFSAASRKRMAAAQRARWKAIKQAAAKKSSRV